MPYQYNFTIITNLTLVGFIKYIILPHANPKDLPLMFKIVNILSKAKPTTVLQMEFFEVENGINVTVDFASQNIVDKFSEVMNSIST